MFSPRRVVFLLCVVGIVSALSVAALVARTNPRVALPPADASELPVLDTVPAFSLTDSEGQAFSPDQVRGRLWVASFFFTRCNGPCPIMNANVAQLVHRFRDHVPDVQFVSVTVDPDHDSAPVLKEYAAGFLADPAAWHFLTGSLAAIRSLAVDGFHVGSLEDPIVHSTRLILIDRQGRIRSYYDGTAEDDVDRLQHDISALLTQS